MGWRDWVRTVEIEPSLYAADFTRLGEEAEVMLRAGVRVFHFDVGDGHFVEPITMGPIVLQWIAPLVHGMDGGIDNDNVRTVYDAGARLMVAGNAIFGREDKTRAYHRLVQALA